MTTPRFEPRSFCTSPAHFGRFITTWREVSDKNSTALDRLGAAKIQHDVALRMRRSITGSRHKTIENYAAFIGTDPTRLGRMLRGTIVMRMEDVINAERNLGLQFWPVRSEVRGTSPAE